MALRIGLMKLRRLRIVATLQSSVGDGLTPPVGDDLTPLVVTYTTGY